MDNKEFKEAFGSMAKAYGFGRNFGCWFKESSECIFVFLLQKSNFGNYYYVNFKIFIQGAFGHQYKASKELFKNDVGDIFLRNPKEYDSAFDLDLTLGSEERLQIMNTLFKNIIVPLSEKALSKAGIFELEQRRILGIRPWVSILPAVLEELEKLLLKSSESNV